MGFLKLLGLAIAVALLLLTAFVAWTPWRAHGGRFITEYLALSGVILLLALVILAVSLRFG